ncbi:MAG: YqgE/AlgH family protein [Rhodocyclales bacterium]|nr:YqgE/AlgH family protein [Rhodocyclales bacterium]
MRRLACFLVLVCLGLPGAPAQAAEEAAPSRSVLLIANEDMEDPRFRQTVVLVTRHGRSRSTIGVILNRPSEVRLDQVFPDFAHSSTEHRLHYGGPVAQGQIVFLVRGDVVPKAAITLADKLYISSDGQSLKRLLLSPTPPDRLRVFDGFASWAPGQLEQELDRGDWYLLPVDADTVFNLPAGEIWERLLRRATQRMVRAWRPGALALGGD